MTKLLDPVIFVHNLDNAIKNLKMQANNRKLSCSKHDEILRDLARFDYMMKEQIEHYLNKFYVFVRSNRDLYDRHFLSHDFLQHSKMGKIRICDVKKGIVIEMLTRYENESERSYIIIPFLFLDDLDGYRTERVQYVRNKELVRLYKLEEQLQDEFVNLKQRILKVKNQISEYNLC